jgi:nucleotide-binding universal stress UspA family protein
MAEGQKSAGVIVVGVDGSEPSKNALRWALDQAQLTGAVLDVVSTWDYPPALGWAPSWPADWDPAAETKKAAAKVIDECHGPAGVEVRQTVVEGHAAPVLVKASAEADLLVVGSRGHGEFAGMLIGSVSEYCALHSQCPVVIVHHHDK